MTEQAMATQPWEDYQIIARNPPFATENKIHGDEMARSLGFAGGLVPGTTVYSYMTFPLVERFGERWLGEGRANLKLLKPAYEGDRITVRTQTHGSGKKASEEVTVTNQVGETLAVLHSKNGPTDSTPGPLVGIRPPHKPPEASKPLVSWERMVLDKPFWALDWLPGKEGQAAWLDSVEDRLPFYRREQGAPLHPGLLLQAANDVLKEQFLLPAWIHVSSDIKFHSVLRLGERIEVRALPTEKFEKNGDQFVSLNVLLLAGGIPALEVTHLVIFRVAGARA